MKKNLLAAALFAGAVLGVSAAQTSYDYSAGLNNTLWYGSGKAETYDVAIELTNPALVGMKVTSITVPLLPASEDNVLDLKFFMTSKLDVQLIDGKNVVVPDIASYDIAYPATADPGAETATVTYTLSEPYVIPEGGIYVGYELRVKKVDASCAASNTPIACSTPGRTGGFWLRSSRSQRTWAEVSAKQNEVLQINVGLEGDLVDNAVGISNVERYKGVLLEAGQANVEVVNTGNNPVKSITYVTHLGDHGGVYQMDLSDDPIPAVYGAVKTLQLNVPTYWEVGTQPLTINITEVNGENNGSNKRKYEGEASVLPFIPKFNPYVEEYTGTGCQYCPRGYAAMEHMKETYPSEFIAAVWHGYNTSDPMYPYWGSTEGIASWPSQLVSAFPYATINRTDGIDPYFGYYNDRFGLEDAWKEAGALDTNAEIHAWAQWDAANDNLINVSSAVTFVSDGLPGETYRIEYVLVADGVKDDNDDETDDVNWAQTSAYNNANGMEYMEAFVGKGTRVYGLTYNDVAVLSSGVGGIKGSVPEAKYGVPVSNTAVLNTLKAINYKKQVINFKKENLRVIALLLKDNGICGEVVNCTRVDILDAESGIETINGSDNKVVTNTIYFDLTGRRVANPQAGTPVIRLNQFNDGSSVADKVIF